MTTCFIAVLLLLHGVVTVTCLKSMTNFRNKLSWRLLSNNIENNGVPSSIHEQSQRRLSQAMSFAFLFGATVISKPMIASAEETEEIVEEVVATAKAIPIDFGTFKLPYFHENLAFKQFLGSKATIVFNMKIDDPQTVLQFPDLVEIYNKYSKEGLNVHAFPSEQGWFEPDDDETCRLKAKEYYGFGNFPSAVVFDKVDVLGPSASPLFTALTQTLKTPNGYGRITLNYEKFLLDANGYPVRRYPRKFSAYDMEPDIVALLNGNPLPEESPQYLKAWREAKREAVKGEYSFRYNYNYYTAPDSMYKYNPSKDVKETKNI